MKNKIQKLINNLGYQIIKFPDEHIRRKIKLLEIYKINTILDIGANAGQYAMDIRKQGYKNKIVSFEPLSDAFEQLKNNSRYDKHWIVENLAIGDRDEDSIINISSNSYSSSLLQMNENHITNATDDVKFIGTEEVKVKKLDTVFKNYYTNENDIIFLKIDAQGYENKILNGATESLKYIKGMQIEMPMKELYKGQTLFLNLINRLDKEGFKLQGIEQGFYNPKTMELYEIDGIFIRE